MALGTMVWTVTFRLPGQQAQAEITKYTKEAADKVSAELEMLGGTVVVTEDFVEDAKRDDIEPAGVGPTKLTWG